MIPISLRRPQSGAAEERPHLLYLLTNELSSTLTRGQFRYLIDNGFDVTVGTGINAPEDGHYRFDEGTTVVILPFVREPAPKTDAIALWRTISLLRTLRPALVNASTPKAGLIGMAAALITRVPVRVYVVRGLRFETSIGVRRRLLRMAERAAMRCATKVVFNSASLKTVAEREGLIEVGAGWIIGSGSGNGVALDSVVDLPDRAEARQLLQMPPDVSVIGFVGRFTRDKGVADLVDVMRSAEFTSSSLRLLLVGGYENGDPVDRDTRERLETDPRIMLVPWLDRPGIAYRAMDVLAFPSYREGLPNVPLEAQLCGTPVVGYSATGTVDAVRHGITGWLVPVGDRSELAACLRMLLSDPKLRLAMGVAGQQWIREEFDQRRFWGELADNYRAWLDSGDR